MRNGQLHRRLENFTVGSNNGLSLQAAGGAEMPFEVVEQRGGTASLYCYRPLTAEFIRGRLDELSSLESFEDAAALLAGLESTDGYLREHGDGRVPADPRARAEVVLATFLTRVFADRSEFGFGRLISRLRTRPWSTPCTRGAARRRSSPRSWGSR